MECRTGIDGHCGALLAGQAHQGARYAPHRPAADGIGLLSGQGEGHHQGATCRRDADAGQDGLIHAMPVQLVAAVGLVATVEADVPGYWRVRVSGRTRQGNQRVCLA